LQPPSLLHADDHRPNSALTQHPFHLLEEIFDQGFGILERVGPARIVFGAMLVIARPWRCLEPKALGCNAMRVVESDQPFPVRRVQRERV